MRLLIVSHTPHFRQGRSFVGWGATVREIDHLATLFDEIVHLAPVHTGSPPGSSLPYQAPNVRVCPVTPAGGTSILSKAGVLLQVPAWAAAIRRELRETDAVHVRCPANISLVALLMLIFSRHPRPRWVKYAGNWRPTACDPYSYRLQRWLLRQSGHGAVVTVNGRWPSLPDHVMAFHNPCLTRQELDEGRRSAGSKRLEPPFHLVFVGNLTRGKGADTAIRVAQRLSQGSSKFLLEIVGDGPFRSALEDLTKERGLQDIVRFRGAVPRNTVPEVLTRAHFVLHPSRGEGFPKVLGEGMAYGAVPIAGAVSAIPQLVEETGAGIAIDPQDEQGFADAVLHFVSHEDAWSEAVEKGLAVARRLTYDAYLEDVVELFKTKFGITLGRDCSRTSGAS